MTKPFRAVVLLTACLLTVFAPAASAATLRVLTTGAFKQVVVAFVAAHEAETGDRVEVSNDTAGALQKRVDAGERFDVLVLTPAALADYAARGVVQPASVVPLARVGIGVAVKSGSPAPRIDTVEAFRQTLIDARAVAYIDPASGGSSGVYLQELFERLGVAAQVAPKAVLVSGGYVAPKLTTGDADVAIHQISEILPVPGVTLVGPLPAAIQSWTRYAGAVGSASTDVAAAQALLRRMTGPGAVETIRRTGMREP